MKTEQLTLSMLTAVDAQRFIESAINARARTQYRYWVIEYLEWLHRRGTIKFPPAQLRLKHFGVALPKLARDYLASHRGANLRSIVGAFHRFIKARDLPLDHVGVADLDAFLGRPVINEHSRHFYRLVLFRHLRWLHSNRGVVFQPDVVSRIAPRIAPPLPPIARQFVTSLEPTLRPGSCRTYRASLGHFHRWLDDHGFAVETLSRLEIAGWFTCLLDKGLHPSTRIGHLTHVRSYLRWLDEHGLVHANPDELIRVSDFPKLPQYLPRPLPPDVDRELQERLRRSTDIHQRALLLMRNTGIRVGELAGLEYDCIRFDPRQRPFLKVPLGKLQNERLVPLEPSIYKLVQRLQRSGPCDRRWLLEDPPGEQTGHPHYARALREAARGLPLAEPLTTHRLRHTYATTLLAGGMSLVGVMKLLGHRDYRMTLRYTAITDETIGREYDEALKHLETRYRLPAATANVEVDPVKLLADVTRWLRHHVDGPQLRRLLKRLQRLQAAVQRLLSNSTNP